MKVYNLQCHQQHLFEGWFASLDELERQQTRGWLTCPVCGDADVRRLPSAPHVVTSHAKSATGSQHVEQSSTSDERRRAAQGVVLSAFRELMARTEDVGERFAEQARAIHQGDVPARDIRGKATPEEVAALLEEGIDVLPLPDLDGLKGPLQ